MNFHDKSQHAMLPNTLFYQPPCIRGFPFSAEIIDNWFRVGSGIGNEESAIQTAIGEYFERRHFYMEIFPDKKHTLGVNLRHNEIKTFLKAFLQTSNGHDNTQLMEHEFAMTKVIRTSDFSECHIPTVLISLSYQHCESDNSLYPSRDTCGCSFHSDAKKSIFGAIKETLERQFLIRFWLTGHCTKTLSSQQIALYLKDSTALPLFSALTKSGILTAIEISDHRFPGVCILLVYGNSNTNKKVHYCAGMDYAETLSEALKKSLYELWQTYRFMNLFQALGSSKSTIKDSYLKHFLSCNTFDTYKEIIKTKKSNHCKPKNKSSFSPESLLQTLSTLNIDGYLYTKLMNISGINFTASCFLSPDLFLHMDNSKNINIANSYSSDFVDDIDTVRAGIMVPFP